LHNERRRYQRVIVPVLYRIPKHSAPRRQVKNLSIGGVRIYSDENLDIGQTLELEFFLPNGITIEAAAKVVWIKKQQPGSEGLYDVGMEFTDLSEVALIELDSVLNRD
jgi:c-di-GMP-binding flagellar brake protein YcgR